MATQDKLDATWDEEAQLSPPPYSTTAAYEETNATKSITSTKGEEGDSASDVQTETHWSRKIIWRKVVRVFESIICIIVGVVFCGLGPPAMFYGLGWL